MSDVPSYLWTGKCLHKDLKAENKFLVLVTLYPWRYSWHGCIQNSLRPNDDEMWWCRWMKVHGSYPLAHLQCIIVLANLCWFYFIDNVLNNLDTIVVVNNVRWWPHCFVCVGFVWAHVLNWTIVQLSVIWLINHAYYANGKQGWEKSGKSEHSNIQNTIEKKQQQ